jgi:hypothetical protein
VTKLLVVEIILHLVGIQYIHLLVMEHLAPIQILA